MSKLPASPGESLNWIAGGARSAISFKAFLPMWAWLLALEGVLRAPASGWKAWMVVLPVALLGIPVASGCALVSARHAAGRHTSWLDWWVRGRQAWPVLVSAMLFTLSVPGLLLSVACAGALLGRIPHVGSALWGAWALTGGLVASVFAAAWLLVGVPSLVLQLPASVLEAPDPMDIASRSLSYVRRRPLLVVSLWALNVASCTLATFAALLFLSLVLGSCCAMASVGEGIAPDPDQIWAQVVRVWSHPLAVWPFPLLPWSRSGIGGSSLFPPLAGWMLPVARLAPAYFCAALLGGATRVYSLVRARIDGTELEDFWEPAAPPATVPDA